MNATAICVARGLRSLLLASRETAIRRTVNPTKHPRVLGLISSYSKVCWCPGTGGEVALLEPSLSVYTHIHTYIHTYIRTYIYIYTCIHTYIHVYHMPKSYPFYVLRRLNYAFSCAGGGTRVGLERPWQLRLRRSAGRSRRHMGVRRVQSALFRVPVRVLQGRRKKPQNACQITPHKP